MKKKFNLDKQTTQLLIISAAMFIIMTILQPTRFLRPINIHSMLSQLAEPGMFALCISVAFLCKGNDLSIVSVANLVGIVNGIILRTVMPDGASNGQTVKWLLICVLTAISIGAVCGLMNGFLIAELGISPILATLGTQSLITGIGMALTQGRAEGNFPELLLRLDSINLFVFGSFMGIPFLTVFFILVLIIMCIIIHKTPFGFKLQLYGSNSYAAFFTGINNKAIVYKTFLLSSFIASLTGIVNMAHTNSAKADYGGTWVFQAMLTCVLAGISPLGGRGKIYNLLLSLIALQILSTGFNMMRVSPLIRDSLFGFLLVFSIVLDFVLTKQKARRLNRKAIMTSGSTS